MLKLQKHPIAPSRMRVLRILRRKTGYYGKNENEEKDFMKTAQDPRHQQRITSMQQLFSYSFYPDHPVGTISPILEHLSAIDHRIEKAAPEWPLSKIAQIDLAILRLAVWELKFESSTPPKVVIDEAIELAKSYGNEHSAQFINGALGAILTS